ncbi:MAG: DUF1826 domain-containing protein [Planctomycetes bacterium]|nr:DUF1826 domain-containing protein [Planctomycetota bacterium]
MQTLTIQQGLKRFIAEDSSDVARRLQSPDADIILLPKPMSLNMADTVRDLPELEKRSTVAFNNAERFVSATLEEMGLLQPQFSQHLLEDIQLFESLFKQTSFELRLEVTEHQSCPKFHCDNVYVRLLVTYFGPTTEFIDQNEPGVIYRAPLNALVFLKGHKHPTYQDRILHRSPEFAAGDKRLCMIVNFSDWMPKR